MKKEFKTLFAASILLLSATVSKGQGWTVSGTNTYTNPLNNLVGIGTSTPSSWVKLDVMGSIKTNYSPIYLAADTYHGVGYYNVYTTTGNYANKTVDGPVLFGYAGGALGSNQAGTKNIALSWLANGNVGVGMINPSAKFHATSGSEIYTGKFENFIVDDNRIAGIGVEATVTTNVGPSQNYSVGLSGIAKTPSLSGNMSSFNYGVKGDATGGHSNYGGYFTATAPTSQTAIGGYCTATGTGSYGVYAQSFGANSNGVYSFCSGTGSWAGYFLGNVYASGTYSSSDVKLKRDIKPLVSALDKLNLLKPSSYDYKTDEYRDMNLPEGKQMGLIAQDLEKVFPELVREVNNTEVKDKDGKTIRQEQHFKAVNYTGLIPVLIAAIQEQQKNIEELKKQLIPTTITKEGIYSDAKLFQNEPNPFNEQTIIKYNLPAELGNAYIAIYDLSGKQLMKLALTSKGESAVTINSNELSAGMYIYSIIADNKLLDSKQMIITEN